MATPILPEEAPIRTHAFASNGGKLYRVVDRNDGEPTLETSSGAHVGYCDVTGPEILKLASKGSDLWNGLRRLVELMATREGIDLYILAKLDGGVAEALALLDATAQTFDHNEPEESPVERRPRHDPERPIPLVGPEEVDRG